MHGKSPVKLNRSLFWLCSLLVSLMSCYLFCLSRIQLYKDSAYIQSLQLSPGGDTMAIPIGGSILLSFVAAIGHLLILGTFLIMADRKEKDITLHLSDVLPYCRKNGVIKTIIQILAYIITAFWIEDFTGTSGIKFFPGLLAFTIIAVIVTWIYALWLTNLLRRKANEDLHERTT